jgi:hypothetical protein
MLISFSFTTRTLRYPLGSNDLVPRRLLIAGVDAADGHDLVLARLDRGRLFSQRLDRVPRRRLTARQHRIHPRVARVEDEEADHAAVLQDLDADDRARVALVLEVQRGDKVLAGTGPEKHTIV